MKIAVANPPGRLTRPRLYKRKSRFFRGKKSHLPARMTLANPKKRISRRRRTRSSNRKRRHLSNPFQGTLMTLNPVRRHKMARHRRHRRHRTHSNPVAHRRHRRHSRRSSFLMNPSAVMGNLTAIPKQMASVPFLQEAAGVGAGIILPGLAIGFLPPAWTQGSKLKFYGVKVATIAALTTAARMVSPKFARYVLVGGGVSLLMDVYTEFIMPMIHGHSIMPGAAPAVPSGTNAYYGPKIGTGAYYGPKLGTGDMGAWPDTDDYSWYNW